MKSNPAQGKLRQEFADGWDWKKMLPSWTYNKLVLDGLPGWEFDDDGEHFEAMCHFVMGHKKQSRKIAIEIDDWCVGMFYYSDKTGDTLPFVNPGEEYVSFFSFQLERDYQEFMNRYGREDGPASPVKLELAAEFGRKKRGWSEESIRRYLI